MKKFTSNQNLILAILTCINFVNWIDRQVLYPLFPLIQDEFRVSYEQLGLLVTAFSIVHSAGSLGLGRLGDRISRKKVIGGGILFWSGATFLCGLAGTFRSLVASRALVGVGEAAYAPSATAIISGIFERKVRARVQAVFDAGMFLGGAAGFMLGGLLAGTVGWRPAFFIVGLPGLLLAATAFRLPEVSKKEAAAPVHLRELIRIPGYGLAVLAGGCMTFAGHTYVIWGAEFLHRYKGMNLSETGIMLGIVLVVMGVPGVLSGAWFADRLARRFHSGRAIAVACGCFLAAPLIYCVLHIQSVVLTIASFGMGTFFLTWYHGPVTAIIHDLTPPRVHATAMGVYYFLINLLATTAASWIVGRVADRSGLIAGMHAALAMQVAGGFCFLLVARAASKSKRFEEMQMRRAAVT